MLVNTLVYTEKKYAYDLEETVPTIISMVWYAIHFRFVLHFTLR